MIEWDHGSQCGNTGSRAHGSTSSNVTVKNIELSVVSADDKMIIITLSQLYLPSRVWKPAVIIFKCIPVDSGLSSNLLSYGSLSDGQKLHKSLFGWELRGVTWHLSMAFLSVWLGPSDMCSGSGKKLCANTKQMPGVFQKLKCRAEDTFQIELRGKVSNVFQVISCKTAAYYRWNN